MAKVTETELPGFGVRYDLSTEDGRQLGVLAHRTGRRDLLVYDAEDPDRCSETIELGPDESHTVAELLGGARLTERLEAMQQDIEGLVIDWLNLPDGAPASGRSIGDLEIRTRTGVSIVAVIHDGQAVPAPGPEYRFRDDDTVVAVGTASGIEQVTSLLRG